MICDENHGFYHFNQILPGACYLTLFGNIIIYMTIIGYFIFFDNDEDNVYGGMA